MLRIVPCGLLLAVLAACSSGDILREALPAGYVPDAAAKVAAADWSAARSVEVDLSEFEFAPNSLTFDRSQPYRLVLRNDGSFTHTFTSKGFFQAIAAQKLVSATGVQTLPYIEQIEVPAGGSKELDFVAERAGRYPLECSVFMHAAFGMTGEIVIR